MLRMRIEARHGLRWGLLSLATAIALTAVSTDPADARSRRGKRAATASSSYSPRYAAIVVDAKTGTVLQAANADALRHPASLTKIMTLYLLFERLEAGKLKLDTPVARLRACRRPGADQARPEAGPDHHGRGRDQGRWSPSRPTTPPSSSPRTLAGTEDEFARQMTRKARALGMSHTVYRNASGLPDDEQVTTARDQAMLGRAIQERFPRYYRYFSTRRFTYRGQRIAQPQPAARHGRRRRRHQDRLHPRLRLQSRHLGAAQRPPYRRGRARRRSAPARATRACASLIDAAHRRGLDPRAPRR